MMSCVAISALPYAERRCRSARLNDISAVTAVAVLTNLNRPANPRAQCPPFAGVLASFFPAIIIANDLFPYTIDEEARFNIMFYL